MSQKQPISIIDYQMGNLRSVQKAIEMVGGKAVVTSDPDEIRQAEKVILPGVGAFGDAMRELELRRLPDAIHQFLARERPFLGICLGMQLLFDRGEEGGDQRGLGVIPGEVVRFNLPKTYKVPHMGWNEVVERKTSLLSGGNFDQKHFYFVHSYYCVPEQSSDIWLETEYGSPFCSAVARNHVLATQFHPEKSQKNGLDLLKIFVDL